MYSSLPGSAASSQAGLPSAAMKVHAAGSDTGSLPSGPQASSATRSGCRSVPPLSSVRPASKTCAKTTVSVPWSASIVSGHWSLHQSTASTMGQPVFAAPGVPRSPAP